MDETTKQQDCTAVATQWDQYEAAIKECSTYTAAQRDAVLWLNNLGRQENMTLASLGDAINYSPTVVQRVLSGTYGAGVDKVITSIYRYKSLHEARLEAGDKPPYVQTSMAQRIWDAADYARVRQQIVSVIGMTQRGKTTAIREYSAAKGATVLVRCPVSPSPGKMIRRMAQALGNTGTGNMDMYMDYLYRTITPQHLIVVDEIHQVILQERKLGIRTVETLREIADECNCGMLLIGTKVWCDALNKDMSWKGVLEQIVKRGMTVALKDTLPLRDLKQLWQHYGLPEPGADIIGYVKAVANDVGLGRYTKLLSIGYTLASKAGEPYGWHHFQRAADMIEVLAKGL